MAKKTSNKYQLLTVFSTVLAVLYGWQFYKSFHIYTDSRNHKILFNGILLFMWIILAISWFRQYKKTSEQENTNHDN
ncbi:hypothetical protein [Rhizosphaericola mali]|uniref:Uncharacterized protein n=1 Tax=Rhizosphaericola mali TaxID=2545455 RepID=A0A5P2FVW4_9BACT|nr:hypothetical protein [Rhizosphaericola mali]QES87656.1 hypothetical protein E0W69_002900 [Rhizosphaericola mali]